MSKMVKWKKTILPQFVCSRTIKGQLGPTKQKDRLDPYCSHCERTTWPSKPCHLWGRYGAYLELC